MERMGITWGRESMGSTKTRKKSDESYWKKKLCFRLNKGISMKKSIWSNKKNQNDDFDQVNKVKLLWKKMPDFYEKKRPDFI